MIDPLNDMRSITISPS